VPLLYSDYMQMNIYVPRDREQTLRRLDRASRRTGRPKSELVLEAIDAYLQRLERGDRTEHPSFQTFDLGSGDVPSRADLYRPGRPS
jgi:hypothetical protein